VSRSATRERLVTAAAALFYANGINATGVDAVVVSSGISKPTLYSHFRSKDDLVAAVLERRLQHQVATVDPWVRSRAATPRDRLLAVFDWLAQWHAESASRGCAFVNAAVELPESAHPAREVARRQKSWWRGYLAGLAAEAAIAEPDRAGADLLLLMDGASARMAVDRDTGAAGEARRLAATLLDAWGVHR
jgi:AcrR family transcriptional regulator